MDNKMIENTAPGMICPLLSVARAIDKGCDGICIGMFCGWWRDGHCAITAIAKSLDNLNENGITVEAL